MTGGPLSATHAHRVSGAIGLYYADTRDVSAAAVDALVTEEDREHALSTAQRLRQTQRLAGRALLRFALEHWTAAPAASHRLRIRAGGKPECVDGPAISVSHNGTSLACTIAESAEVGVDVQHVEPRRHTVDIARQYFSQAETAWLDRAPPDAFYMLWVLKEAYLKALGSGLAGGLRSLDCRVEPPDIRAETAVPAALALYAVGDAHLGVAALGYADAAIRVECWRPSRLRAPLPPRLVAKSSSP